jgi:hypothetical protein
VIKCSEILLSVLFAALLLGLKCKVRVHPATSECQEYTKPLPWAQNLALAVPPDAQNEDSLQMADNVEGQSTGASNNQELRQIVHGCHDARRAGAPENVGGNFGKGRNGVEKWHKGNEEADGNRGLVEQELRWRNGEVFNLLADPDLVQGGGAESQCCNNDTEELGLGSLVDGEADADAGCNDGAEHVACDLFAEHDEVDKDDGRGGHDLGQLVEADGVEGQGQVAEDDVAGEEAADGQHVDGVEADGLEGAEGAEGRDEEDEAGCGEMPHDHHELALLDLCIAKDPVLLLAMPLPDGV